MAPPPAKRQRRLVVYSSEEEEQHGSIKPGNHGHNVPISNLESTANSNPKRSLPTRSRTKPKSAALQAVTDSSPQRPTRSSGNIIKRQTSKPISTFFNAANQIHQTTRQTPDVAIPEEDPDIEDFIEDVSPNEEIEIQQSTHDTTRRVLDRRKKLLEEKPPSNSQRFKFRGNAAGAAIKKPVISSRVDTRPWPERYGPNKLDELVVHKKKVSDVRSWLENAFQGRDRKVCLSSAHAAFH